MEASLHDMVQKRYVVHTHPYAVNALLCSRDCAAAVRRLFGDTALLVPASDPGYVLAKRMEEALAGWRKTRRADPTVILMQNHGLVVAGETPAEVHATTAEVMAKVASALGPLPDTAPLPVPDAVVELLPAIRMMCSPVGAPAGVAAIRNSALVQHFFQPGERAGASLPFTPDHIVYCRTAPLEAAFDGNPARFLESFPRLLDEYAKRHGGKPRVILVSGLGMIGVDDSKRSVDTCLDVFEERLKISHLSRAFGGPAFLSSQAIRFIETWEVESYRRSVSTGGTGRRVDGKVALVTGAAQGFGRGIAEGLFAEGANVVIADLNEIRRRGARGGAQRAAGPERSRVHPGRRHRPGVARAPRGGNGLAVRGRRPPRVERRRAAGRQPRRDEPGGFRPRDPGQLHRLLPLREDLRTRHASAAPVPTPALRRTSCR